MDPNENYNPADDDNQGIVQLMAQGEEANPGIAQANYTNLVTAQGPEPEKAEVNDDDEGPLEVDTNGVNEDMLEEEDVEDGELDLEEE